MIMGRSYLVRVCTVSNFVSLTLICTVLFDELIYCGTNIDCLWYQYWLIVVFNQI